MEILDRIGSGTFGAVYKVKVDGEIRAAKTNVLGIDDDSIKKEIAQLSRVNHINIVTVFGLQLHENVQYLIIEYMEGGSMNNLIGSQDFKLTDVVNWFSQVAAGLSYLHAMTPQPMLHRDIKPHNILLSGDLQVAKIGDFGTSRDLASTMSDNKGTPVYMAPEVFKSGKYTEKCDVYSFGISLWEMLARERPFAECDEKYQIQWAAYEGERPSLEGLGCHRILIDLLDFCWHEDPTVRPVMQIVFKVLRNTLKLYEEFDMYTDVLTGKVAGHWDKQMFLSAQQKVSDFLLPFHRRNISLEERLFQYEELIHYSSISKKFIIGIVDDSKYNGQITKDQWNSIKNDVKLGMVEFRYFQVGGIRTTINLLRNSMVLLCFENESLLEWYEEAIDRHLLFPDRKYRMVDAKDLRLWTEATALLPSEPSDPEAILKLLGESNPHVAIDDWKVLEIEECGQSQIQVIFQLENEWGVKKCILNYGLNTVWLNVIQFGHLWLHAYTDIIIKAELPKTKNPFRKVSEFFESIIDEFND